MHARPRPLERLAALTPMQTLDEEPLRRTFREAVRRARGRADELEQQLRPVAA